jgi:hypothetical protein
MRAAVSGVKTRGMLARSGGWKKCRNAHRPCRVAFRRNAAAIHRPLRGGDMLLTHLDRLLPVVVLAAGSVLLSAGAAAQLYPSPPGWLPAPTHEPAPAYQRAPAYEPAPARKLATADNIAPRTTTPIHAVSVHAGPNGGAPVVGTLKPGMPVEILSAAAPGWLQVRSGSEEGWVWGSYFPGGASEFAAKGLPGGETEFPRAASVTSRSSGVSPAEIASP